MALFSFMQLSLVILLIGLFSTSSNNGFLTYSSTAKAARYITSNTHLKIISFAPPRVKFNDPHSHLLLPCTPSETENVLVTWFRNKQLLNNPRRNEFQIYKNGSLRLPPNEKSNGIYRCLVNGTKIELGALFSNQTFVEYPVLKRKSDTPTNFTAVIAEVFTLDCPIISIPTASISWYFNNASTSIFILIIDENSYVQLKNGSLVIKSVKESNRGRYKCVAHNTLAIKTHRQYIANLNIKQIKNFETISNSKHLRSHRKNDEKLIPKLQEEIQYVQTGDNLILHCDTYKQDIKIGWTFLPSWSNRTYEITNHTKTIEIVNASTDNHEGIYNCSTKSDYQIFEVIVTIPPIIDSPLISYEKQIANKVSLNCTASGKPAPKIFWYHNGIKLENNYTIHINSSYLKINSLDDKDVGIYQCFARNIVGEISSTSYLELKQKDIELLPDRPRNVKCYPINYRLMNVTFESNHHIETININMARKNPREWFAQFPLDTTQKQFLLVQDRIIFEPFMLYLRTIVLTGHKKFNSGKEEKHVEPSLMSEGIECATQGLEIHPVFFPNGIYIWWYYENLKDNNKITIEYFLIQILNDVKDSKENLMIFPKEIIGTKQELKNSDRKSIEEKLEKIPVLEKLPEISKYSINGTDNTEVVNLVVWGNVTGVLIPNTTKLSVRVIAVTEANRNFKQDFRYMEWKNIKRQEKQFAVPMIQSIDSRSIHFQWYQQLTSNISCVQVCYQSTNLNERWIDGKGTCRNIPTKNLIFSIEKLKPKWSLEFLFKDCKTKHVYGTISEITTLADPPGPISNFKIFKSNGYKLTWEEPLNPNGKIMAYLVEWTVNNSTTYQANVTANEKYFQLPNTTDNINISVRAYGENSLGLPIYIDLSKNSQSIETEKNDYFDPVIGVAIGLLLSILCVLCFIFLYIKQKQNFKTRLSSSSTTTMAHFPPISTADLSLPTSNSFEISTQKNHISTKPLIMNSLITSRKATNTIELSKLQREPDSHEVHEKQTLIRQPNLNVISFKEETTLTPFSDVFPVSQNGDANTYYFQNSKSKNEFQNETCPVKLCSSTPISQRNKSTNFNTKQYNKEYSLMPMPLKYKNKEKPKCKNNKLNKANSSPDFNINILKENLNSKTLETSKIDIDITIDKSKTISKNSSIKNILPSLINRSKPIQSDTDRLNCNTMKYYEIYDRNSDMENIHCTIDSSSNKSPTENNSQYILIEDNNSSCDKYFSQNSTNNDSSNLSMRNMLLNCEGVSIDNSDRSMADKINTNTNCGKVSIQLKEDIDIIKKAEQNTQTLIKNINKYEVNNEREINLVNYRRPIIIDPNG